MLTVSAAAMFTPQCQRGQQQSLRMLSDVVLNNSSSSSSSSLLSNSPSDISCTTIQSVDSIIWAVTMLCQLTAIVCAWGYFCMNAFLTQNQLRLHLTTHYKLYQVPNTCCVFGCYILMPAGIAVRTYQQVDETTWLWIVVLCGVYFSYIFWWWNMIIWNGLEILGGEKLSFFQMFQQMHVVLGTLPNNARKHMFS